IGPRADLFSLGSVLYEMCTGRPAFRAATTAAVLKRVCDETPRPIREVNPDIPEALCRLIDRLHAKKPADRPASAKEAADLLAGGVAGGRAGEGRGAPPRRRRPAGRTAAPGGVVPPVALGRRGPGPAVRRPGPGRGDRRDRRPRHRDPPVLARRHAGRGSR